MARRPRNLRPDELDLWRAVAGTARPLHPQRKTGPKSAPLIAAPAEAPPEPVPPKPIPVFRVGEKTFKKAAQDEAHSKGLARQSQEYDLATSTVHRLAEAPLRMDHKTFRHMTRGKTDPEARIDLHGHTLAEAHPELIRFVLGAHAAGRRLVLVITGKGRPGRGHEPHPSRMGALRQQVPHWLSLPPLRPVVLQVTEAHLKHGGSGAYYVYLRRPR